MNEHTLAVEFLVFPTEKPEIWAKMTSDTQLNTQA
jgi:hypothetical protein